MTKYELLQKYTTNEFAVRMPAEYPGARTRMAEVVALVGDSKWIWSMFGFVCNWKRPLASGPFTADQVNATGAHVPVVYDRQFYRDIFKQYAELVQQAGAVKHVLVEVRSRTQPSTQCHARRCNPSGRARSTRLSANYDPMSLCGFPASCPVNCANG